MFSSTLTLTKCHKEGTISALKDSSVALVNLQFLVLVMQINFYSKYVNKGIMGVIYLFLFFATPARKNSGRRVVIQ